MTATTAPNQATVDRDDRRAMGNFAWVLGSLAAYGLWVAFAHAFPVEDEDQLGIKVWLAFFAVVGAIVQLLTMSRVYGWIPRFPPGAAATLSAVHRWSGRITLVVGGGVAYLCMTGPFAPGFTLHRLFGYLLVAVILVKIVILRLAERLSGLLPVLGLTAVAGWIACFLTKGLVVWFK